jgi:cyclic lactone autoinducer peptide
MALKVVSSQIKKVAIFGSNATCIFYSYQPKTPDCLKQNITATKNN